MTKQQSNSLQDEMKKIQEYLDIHKKGFTKV